MDRFTRLAAEPFTTIDARGLHGRGRGGKLGELYHRRELLLLLIGRDLQARYRDSFLGFLWTVIRPLVQFLVYYLVLGRILGAERGIDNFAIYLFAGFTLYTFVAEVISGATGSIIGNAGLVKKIYLPREIFPLGTIGASGFMFVVQLVVLLVAAIALQALPAPVQMLWFFPSLGMILLWSVALGLLLSALNVYLRDIQYLTEVVVMLAMWASPIVYSWSMVKQVAHDAGLGNWILELYLANPLTIGVMGFQRAFWGSGTAADYPEGVGTRMLIMAVIGAVFLWISHRIFTRVQGNFAQEL